MTSRWRISNRASRELDEIWLYSARNWGLERADRYLDEIVEAFLRLANDPELGRCAAVVRQGYRKHLVGRHIVFFRCVGGDIEVVRVLHEKRDFDAHL